jgi:hypothetical protein
MLAMQRNPIPCGKNKVHVSLANAWQKSEHSFPSLRTRLTALQMPWFKIKTFYLNHNLNVINGTELSCTILPCLFSCGCGQ